MRNKWAAAVAAICGTLLSAPVFAPYDETEQHRRAALHPPARLHLRTPSGRVSRPYVIEGAQFFPVRIFARAEHVIGVSPPGYLFLFGSDEYGRDLFSRFLYGGRRALLVGIFASLAAVSIGFAAGACAGFYEGWLDALLMRSSELFLSLPWMYLLLAIRALLPLRLSGAASLATIVAVAALAGWPGPARLVRGIFLSAKRRPYIAVARSLGASSRFIITRHILPEVRTVLWTQGLTLLPQFMLVDVALSFLGLAESEPHATWGGMLSSLRHLSTVESHSGYLIAAGAIALIIFVLQLSVEKDQRQTVSMRTKIGSIVTRTSNRTMLFLCLLHGLSFLLTAGEPVQRGGKLVVALRAEPKTLNPLVSLDGSSREVIGRMNADLISIDRFTQSPAPSIAESWTVSADCKHYRINLRKQLRFSDGHPFDSDDVVFSFQAYLDERAHSPQRDPFIINGAPVRVQKLDQYTVQFDLPSPYATTERLFDGVAMLPRHLLQQSFADGTLARAWTLNTPPAQIAGLGPFRLKDYSPGERIVLERNPYYWKTGQPYLDQIEFVFVGDEDAQVARFMSGETDLISRVSAKNAMLLRSHGFTVQDAGPSLEYNFLFFNLSPKAPLPAKTWFEQRAFRQAISYAIDRPSIVKLIFAGLATPLSTHVTPANRNWAAPGADPGPANPNKARELLRSAGFTWDGSGLLADRDGHRVEFTILTSSSNADRTQMAALIQDDLKSVGITIHLVTLEFRSMVDRVLQTHDYDAAIMALGAGDGDPNSELNVWLSTGAMHIWNPRQEKPATPWEAEIDSLMHKQQGETDSNARRLLYLRVLQIEAEQEPIISLVSPHVLVARSARVHNLRPAIFDNYALWNADELFVDSAKAATAKITAPGGSNSKR